MLASAQYKIAAKLGYRVARRQKYNPSFVKHRDISSTMDFCCYSCYAVMGVAQGKEEGKCMKESLEGTQGSWSAPISVILPVMQAYCIWFLLESIFKFGTKKWFPIIT